MLLQDAAGTGTGTVSAADVAPVAEAAGWQAEIYYLAWGWLTLIAGGFSACLVIVLNA